MYVYLIRHAHAVGTDENPSRPLSGRGRKQVAALAEFLAPSHLFQPAEIWHSPLLRSRETAELLARHLDLKAPLQLVPGLEPEADVTTIARRLKAPRVPIAIVGHEPHLSSLASLLVTGRAYPSVFAMKKSCALALEPADDVWQVCWHISPELIA